MIFVPFFTSVCISTIGNSECIERRLKMCAYNCQSNILFFMIDITTAGILDPA